MTEKKNMRTILCGMLCATTVTMAQTTNRASIVPTVSVSHFVLDGNSATGPSVALKYESREFESMQLGISAGVMFRPNGVVNYETQPFIYTQGDKLYPLQPPIANGAYRSSSYGVGLEFLGVDIRTYLADGDMRPYVGVGARLVTWSATTSFTGTLAPEALAGLEMRVGERVSGFVEVDYLVGMPTIFGERSSSLSNIGSFAFGLSFAPRW